MFSESHKKQANESISGTGNYSSLYYATKNGNVVTLFVSGVVNSTTGIDMDILSLPAGWRPAQSLIQLGTTKGGQLQLTNNATFYTLGTQGHLYAYSYEAFNGGRVSFTYVAE